MTRAGSGPRRGRPGSPRGSQPDAPLACCRPGDRIVRVPARHGRSHMKVALGGAVALALSMTLATPASAAGTYDVGASDAEIKLGNTNPYSGPASSYGTIGRTLQAYWQMVNDRGGINGRKINFISLDDGFQPPKTVEQVRRLVEQDQVLALFQTLGTAPNSAVHKYVNTKKVPHLFVATGATKWGDPPNF